MNPSGQSAATPGAAEGRQSAGPPEYGRVFDGAVAPLVKDGRIGAAAVVVVERDRVVFQRGWGVVDRQTNRAVDPETTVFAAASTSKVFAATAVMQLVEQGRLRLDADVNTYLNRFHLEPIEGPAVTLGHLLTHTAGFEDWFFGAMAAPGQPIESLDDYFTRHPPHRAMPAGSQISYSNHGMALAGHLVERAAGIPFHQYVDERILQALGMRHSTFRQPAPSEIASLFVRDRRPPPVYKPYPAASLVSSAGDMGRFLLAHLNEGRVGDVQILRPDTLQDMHRTHWRAHPGMPGVAYGFFESFVNGERALFHTGDAGHHSLLFMLPDAALGFYVVYAGASDETAGTLREDLARAFTGLSVQPMAELPPPTIPEAASQARKVAGVYRTNQYSRTTLEKVAALPQQMNVASHADGSLSVQLGLGGEWYHARPTGDLSFRAHDGTYLAFQADASGHVHGLSFSSAGVGDPGGAERIAWHDDARLHLTALAVIVALLLSRAIVGGIGLIARWRRRASPAPTVSLARQAWTLSAIPSALVLLTPAWLVLGLLTTRPPFFEVPWFVTIILVSLLLASAGSVVLLALAALAWRRRFWSFRDRLYFSMLTLASVALVPILAYWNLLGFQY